MSSEFGKIVKVSLFGQSHGRAVGVLIDGLPAGEALNLDELQKFLDRRRPGKNALSTARSEADRPVFLSGLTIEPNGESMTCGFPLCAVMENGDTRSGDYEAFKDLPRPGHADYTARVKWRGHADMRGGGHFSGRLTAPLCVAGGIAKQILARRKIYIGAHLYEAAGIPDRPFPSVFDGEPDEKNEKLEELFLNLFLQVQARDFPVIDIEAGERMQAAILEAAREGDSVGGIIECAAVGLPAGLGGPMFEGVESRLAGALFGVPAVKGVEFGAGFNASRMRGSGNNDPFIVASHEGQRVVMTKTNHCGGILGGITDGMPVTLRAAIKPTPSVARSQETVSLSRLEGAELTIQGRHDPCVAHRAVPVIEAVTACVILDMLMSEN